MVKKRVGTKDPDQSLMRDEDHHLSHSVGCDLIGIIVVGQTLLIDGKVVIRRNV